MMDQLTMSSKVLIWLCAFACCMQLSLQGRDNGDSGCRTPSNEVGDCVSYYDCPSIRNRMEFWKRKKVLPNHFKKTLKKYRCGFRKRKVCCPRSTANFPDVTQAPVVNPRPRVTPDVIMPVTTSPQIGGRNLLSLDSCGLSNSENRIFGGGIANLFQFPWMALLAYKTSKGTEYKCGGSLINERYVLTAAHCLHNQILAHVRLGEYDLRTRRDCITSLGCAGRIEDIRAEDVIVHPKFNSLYYHNDIGLIRLQKSIKMKAHISPICLPIVPKLRKETFKNVILAGWGFTENNRHLSEVLMTVKVSTINLTECKRWYRWGYLQITDNHMCTSGSKRPCTGDSGGPVQLIQVLNTNVIYVQHGVISWGAKMCERRPSIHTRVDRYLDWINENVKA